MKFIYFDYVTIKNPIQHAYSGCRRDSGKIFIPALKGFGKTRKVYHGILRNEPGDDFRRDRCAIIIYRVKKYRIAQRQDKGNFFNTFKVPMRGNRCSHQQDVH